MIGIPTLVVVLVVVVLAGRIIKKLAVLLIILAALASVYGFAAENSVPFRLAGWVWVETPVQVDLSMLGGFDGLSADETRRAARNAMQSWNAAANRALLIEGAGPVTIFVGVCDGAVAQTTTYALDGAASRSEICIHDAAVLFATDGATGAYDLETVLLHELGHVLGLHHPVESAERAAPMCRVGEPDRVMCPRGVGVVSQTPLEGDVAGVRTLYGS